VLLVDRFSEEGDRPRRQSRGRSLTRWLIANGAAGTPEAGGQQSDYILREDGSPLLREDGTPYEREAGGQQLDYILAEDGSPLLREDGTPYEME